MKSIKWKLALLYLALISIVMISSGTFIVFELQRVENENSRTMLESYVERIREQIARGGIYSREDFQALLQHPVAAFSQYRGNILDSAGNTIATTVETTPPFTNHRNSVIVSALAGRPAFSANDVNQDMTSMRVRRWMSYAEPFTHNGESFVIFVQMEADSVNQSMENAVTIIVMASFWALAITSVVGYVFANNITTPIKGLTGKAKEFAAGNLDQELVDVKSEDEIGQLTNSLNHMARELNATILAISEERNKQEIIFQNMSDGIIAFDGRGEVMQFNFAAEDMLGEIDKDFNLAGLAKIVSVSVEDITKLNSDAVSEATFSRDERYISANFSPYTNKQNEVGGIIAVLQDVTKHKKLDEMRKEFIANVSHEIRTPLTTIKSYSETLLSGAAEDAQIRDKFLKIINDDADRMTFLVKDLLQLSKFDNNQFDYKYRKWDLNYIVKESIFKNKILADNKKQSIYFTPFEGEAEVVVDIDRIGQVLSNIISNAVKYSFEEKAIFVHIEESEKFFKLLVRDEGIGIPKEDLKRVFERFFRVDKARSRAMGGTGLGLPIAQEIMERHGGRIVAQSDIGEGTTMTAFFPKEFEGESVDETS